MSVSCLPPPAPEDATSWSEFTARLRDLHEWCGRPKYRALCSRCPGLSPAAVSNLIGRNPLTRPPETATARFVEACLRYGDWADPERERARWSARWALIAAAESGGGPPAGCRRREWAVGGAVVAGAVVLAAIVGRRRRAGRSLF